MCVCVSYPATLCHDQRYTCKTYGLFKTYFYSYRYNTFPTDNLLIVRPLKVLPCYLKVASGYNLSKQRYLNAQHCPDMFHTDVMILSL